MQRRRFAAAMSLGALAPGLARSQPTAAQPNSAQRTGQPAGQQPTPVEIAGIQFDRSVRVGTHELKLNGAGIRWKAVFKVYAAALYLAAPAASPDAVLASTGPKRIHLTALRTIEANELGKAFTDAIEKNASRDEFIRSLQSIIEMGQVTAAYRSLNHGDSIVFDWVPGTGTTMFVKGKAEMGPVADPAFFTAMAKIWLGARPVDAQLKDALLGKQPAEQDPHRGA